jgi:hypothetical protein
MFGGEGKKAALRKETEGEVLLNPQHNNKREHKNLVFA